MARSLAQAVRSYRHVDRKRKQSRHHEGPARQSRNQSSEYSRKGAKAAKVGKLMIIRKNFIFPSELGDFAP